MRSLSSSTMRRSTSSISTRNSSSLRARFVLRSCVRSETVLQFAGEGFELDFERRRCRRSARSAARRRCPPPPLPPAGPARPRAPGCEMPKPTASGRSVTARMALDQRRHGVGERIALAGDAGARDQVDEAGGIFAPPVSAAARCWWARPGRPCPARGGAWRRRIRAPLPPRRR